MGIVRKRQGFTLLEILLVVAAIAILAGIVIVAINPGQQLADTRDAQRRVDLRTIAGAASQYRIAVGTIPGLQVVNDPEECFDATNEICKTDASSCSGLVNLSVLTDGARYVPSIPIDPSGSDNANGTGYHIVNNTNSTRFIVCAPRSEGSEDILVTQ